ncbi:MAG: hypothetical protein M3P32_03830 [Chloroflexota bacterium]|nr:hypothetical protein [Chloroflexota bacterium]
MLPKPGNPIHPGRPAAWLAAALSLAVLLAACAAPAPSATPTPVASATVSESTEASPSLEPSPSATPPAPVGQTCVDDPPFDPTTGWTRFESDSGYSFLYPESWVDATGDFTDDLSNRMSPELIDEVVVPDPLVLDLVREPNDEPVFGPVFSVLHLDGVTSDTDELFEQELAWNQTQTALGFTELLIPRVEECIDGQPALGFVADWGGPIIGMFIWEREGAVYQAWISSEELNDVDIAGGIFASWEWGEPGNGGPVGSGAIAGAVMSLDTAETFAEVVAASTFSVGAPRIYMIYELEEGSLGTVTITWREDGEPLFPARTFDWTETTAFAWAWITPAPGGFAPGSFDVVIDFAGDSVTVPFVIE